MMNTYILVHLIIIHMEYRNPQRIYTQMGQSVLQGIHIPGISRQHPAPFQSRMQVVSICSMQRYHQMEAPSNFQLTWEDQTMRNSMHPYSGLMNQYYLPD